MVMARRLAIRRVLVSEWRETAVSHKPPMMPAELKRLNQFSTSHCPMSPILTWEGQNTLEAVGNVTLGIYQQIAWQPDNPFIRPTTGRWRQFERGGIGDVNADDSKITVIKLPNVRA